MCTLDRLLDTYRILYTFHIPAIRYVRSYRLTNSDQTAREGGACFLGVTHATENCTNASRGLSAKAELVLSAAAVSRHSDNIAGTAGAVVYLACQYIVALFVNVDDVRTIYSHSQLGRFYHVLTLYYILRAAGPPSVELRLAWFISLDDLRSTSPLVSRTLLVVLCWTLDNCDQQLAASTARLELCRLLPPPRRFCFCLCVFDCLHVRLSVCLSAG